MKARRFIERAYVDKGYRGHDTENPRRVATNSRHMLNTTKTTAARLATSATSATPSYSSQCKLFEIMTAFRLGAASNCRKREQTVYISNDLRQACATGMRTELP